MLQQQKQLAGGEGGGNPRVDMLTGLDMPTHKKKICNLKQFEISKTFSAVHTESL
jgi:hypothetical protein